MAKRRILVFYNPPMLQHSSTLRTQNLRNFDLRGFPLLLEIAHTIGKFINEYPPDGSGVFYKF